MATAGEQDKIYVNVDPDIRDLIPGFLENRYNDIQSMRDALAKTDFETIRILGHSMKGAGGGYGFDGITDIGAELERAAKVKDTAEITRGIEELASYLSRVEVVYYE
jgi:HPt (histidine-containing phosphotransfer) domain-containing protein